MGETVKVNPNTQYKFSLWISSMVTAFPAKLNFFINGVSMGKKLLRLFKIDGKDSVQAGIRVLLLQQLLLLLI